MAHERDDLHSKPEGLPVCLPSSAKDESGSISIFALFMVFIMLMVGGIGADLMRHEMERTRIQAIADRAVLAAADLDQTLSPEQVARDYFAKSGMPSFVSSVTVDEGLNYRRVRLDATSTMKTQFMDYLGQESLTVPALAEAEEKVAKVEISMVLDISGSMRHNSKMDRLHDAAGEFIDTVLVPENQDLISISVIPYTAQVNAGPEIFDELNINQLHTYSHCVDFEITDFDETALSLTEPYEHMQHFDTGYSWNGSRSIDSISNPGCPKRSFEEIAAFSQNATWLKNRINQFRPRANTAIHLGMKWGVAMLDPSFQSITTELTGIDAAFQSRPASYTDVETLKTIILMTDGENVTTYRINPAVYANYNHRRHWSIYPLNWYLNNYVRSRDRDLWKDVRYTPSQADSMLQSICDAAKAKHIVIWSIGFEVGDHGANVMRNCASSPSHFFRVEGVEITDAFNAIARQINQLRLTL
ncbi:MAG: Tad domain-containing protein [Sulfitobacter sp.]|nr:Tad domain-containing protein [Sulfitobacter sp.]